MQGWSLSHYLTPRADQDDGEFWATAAPFLQSKNFYHDIRHPIRDPVSVEVVYLGVLNRNVCNLPLISAFLIGIPGNEFNGRPALG